MLGKIDYELPIKACELASDFEKFESFKYRITKKIMWDSLLIYRDKWYQFLSERIPVLDNKGKFKYLLCHLTDVTNTSLNQSFIL